ncbi:MAG: lipid A biosynthesis acyltransferase [Gammaproteobacteria bacterium]|nr:lipid A biosynthesis acyltransferase [Gammaproteobacteria bacterium]MCF6259918.1 lipid A biosynthesis acyltransferase [Gammaproteobacteria bacterium]
MTAPRWHEQKERSNRTMLTLLVWAALHLGRRFMMLLLYPVAFYFLLTAATARRASRQYLTRALGRKPGWLDLWKHFYTFAVVSVDRLFFLSGQHDKYQIQVNGAELFQRYVTQKQGCILLVSHLGSFDVMRVLATKEQRLPIRVLIDRQHSPLAAELIDALDPELAAAIIDPAQSAPALALTLDQAIKKGEMIGIMADRAGNDERMIRCEFLGGQANFPVGPWLLGLILKAPVILCFGLYQGGNRYQLNFELLTEQFSAPRHQRDTEISRAMGEYVRRLEHHIGEAPYNWFNFYDFWLDETTTDH